MFTNVTMWPGSNNYYFESGLVTSLTKLSVRIDYLCGRDVFTSERWGSM